MKRYNPVLIALLLSLVVNGVVLGLFVGQYFEGKERRAMHDMTRKLMQQAPSEAAEAVAAAMRAHRRELRSAFRNLRNKRREMVHLLKAESVSREELRVGFAAVRRADDELKMAVHDVLAEVLPGIPVEQRLQVAMLEHQKMRSPKKPDRDRDQGRMPSPPDRHGEPPP